MHIAENKQLLSPAVCIAINAAFTRLKPTESGGSKPNKQHMFIRYLNRGYRFETNPNYSIVYCTRGCRFATKPNDFQLPKDSADSYPNKTIFNCLHRVQVRNQIKYVGSGQEPDKPHFWPNSFFFRFS